MTPSDLDKIEERERAEVELGRRHHYLRIRPARTDIPAMSAEIRRLWAQRDRLLKILNSQYGDHEVRKAALEAMDE